MKILFLVRTNSEYGSDIIPSKAGLRNSARFVVDAVNKFPHTQAVLEFCRDGNEIDKWLHRFRPDICIIEAIWVSPDKLRELVSLHTHIRFVVRIHSRIPFLAMEGNSIAWVKEYVKFIVVSFNHDQTSYDFQELGIPNIYLPNIYPVTEFNGCEPYKRKHLYKIGCFGAIRPFKNQLSQAVAAILWAEKRKAVVHFYVNSSRVEQRGESVVKSLRALFEGTRHKLVEIGWLEHSEFVKLIADMDACMQVSFTETFNIVTADCVASHVPVVVSNAINWLHCRKADQNSESNMAEVLEYTMQHRAESVEDNIHDIAAYNHHAILKWFRYLLR
jgi:hypothetical protein